MELCFSRSKTHLPIFFLSDPDGTFSGPYISWERSPLWIIRDGTSRGRDLLPVALRHAFGAWLCVLFRGAIMLNSEQIEQMSHMARGASCRSCRSMDPSHWKVRIHPLKDFGQCYGFDGHHRNDRTTLYITFWIASIFFIFGKFG